MIRSLRNRLMGSGSTALTIMLFPGLAFGACPPNLSVRSNLSVPFPGGPQSAQGAGSDVADNGIGAPSVTASEVSTSQTLLFLRRRLDEIQVASNAAPLAAPPIAGVAIAQPPPLPPPGQAPVLIAQPAPGTVPGQPGLSPQQPVSGPVVQAVPLPPLTGGQPLPPQATPAGVQVAAAAPPSAAQAAAEEAWKRAEAAAKRFESAALNLEQASRRIEAAALSQAAGAARGAAQQSAPAGTVLPTQPVAPGLAPLPPLLPNAPVPPGAPAPTDAVPGQQGGNWLPGVPGAVVAAPPAAGGALPPVVAAPAATPSLPGVGTLPADPAAASAATPPAGATPAKPALTFPMRPAPGGVGQAPAGGPAPKAGATPTEPTAITQLPMISGRPNVIAQPVDQALPAMKVVGPAAKPANGAQVAQVPGAPPATGGQAPVPPPAAAAAKGAPPAGAAAAPPPVAGGAPAQPGALAALPIAGAISPVTYAPVSGKFAVWGGGFTDVEKRRNIPVAGGYETTASKQNAAGLIMGTDWEMPKREGQMGAFRLGMFAGLTRAETKYTDGVYDAAASGSGAATDRCYTGDTACYFRYGSQYSVRSGYVGTYGIATSGPWSFDLLAKADVARSSGEDKSQNCEDRVEVVSRRLEQASTSITVAGNASYRVQLAPNAWLEPSVGFRYLHVIAGRSVIPIEDTALTGALPAALANGDALRLQAGFRIGLTSQKSYGAWTGILGVFAYNEVMVNGFSSGVNPTTMNLDEGKLRGLVQVSNTFTTVEGVSLQLQFDMRGGQDLLGYGGKVTLRKEW